MLMLSSSSVMALERQPPDPKSLRPISLNFDQVQARKWLKSGQTAVFNACLQDVRDVRYGPDCPGGRALIVREGEILSIRAWGEMRSGVLAYGPDGPQSYEGTAKTAEKDRKIKLDVPLVKNPQIPLGALLCKTSNETEWQYCGRSAYGTVRVPGQLQFTVNDSDHANNRGMYEISVAINGELYAGNPPPWAGMKDDAWKAQFQGLPQCYCHKDKIPGGHGEPGFGGKWNTDADALLNARFSRRYHPGAVWDFRWFGPTPTGTAGQQCIYDENGKLITRGPGAGTPDIHSPAASWLNHRKEDVRPLDRLPVGVYVERWQPNKGLERATAGRARGPCEGNPQSDPPFKRLP
jgi:hypothetical protein